MSARMRRATQALAQIFEDAKIDEMPGVHVYSAAIVAEPAGPPSISIDVRTMRSREAVEDLLSDVGVERLDPEMIRVEGFYRFEDDLYFVDVDSDEQRGGER